MKTIHTMEFRAYAIKELACLYFPDKRAEYATRSLRRLIQHDPLLLSELQERGYGPRLRLLPPSAVQVLLQHLGRPEEFYEIARKA